MGLKLNLAKCAKIHINPRQPEQEKDTAIPTLGISDSYKYLGLEQSKTYSFEETWKGLEKKVLEKQGPYGLETTSKQ